MMRRLYSLLMLALVPLLRWRLAQRGRVETGYLQAIQERFGHYAQPPASGFVWIHAVSLGEVRAAAVLVARLRERLPDMRLLLTHGTATGRAEGAKLLQAGDIQSWQPWDTPAAVRRFLLHFQPRIGILMETEVWPNLAARCQQLGLPLVLANARLSEKSQRVALRLAWLARPAYGSLAAVWAQTQDDATRLKTLGAKVRGVMGNLKFDATPDALQLATGRAWRHRLGRPVVMLASSREGEEQALLQLLQLCQTGASIDPTQATIDAAPSRIQWLIVPRHPQRFAEVAMLIEAHGFAVSRRSTWHDAAPSREEVSRAQGTAAETIWLGDSLGEMALYYGLADVALLGGSFEPLGGQNLIEAAACACPVLMGPHTFNFADAAELAQAAGAARRVPSLQQAVTAAQALAHDPSARASMVSAAAGFSSAHRGAVEKTTTALIDLLRQQRVDAF